jgi:hypothetical protein
MTVREWAHTPWWCLPNYKVGPRKKEGKEAEKRAKKEGEKRRERCYLLHLLFCLVVCLVLVIAPVFSIAIDNEYTINYCDVFNAYFI